MFLAKKSWLLLNRKQKKYMIFIFALIFFAIILESLSVGIVLPLISVLLRGDIDNSFFSFLFSFGNFSGNNLIYIGLFVTFLIFIFKNLALAFNLWQSTKFLRNLEFELTKRLFKYYLTSDYIFFLQNNSGHLYRNLTTIISSFIAYFKAQMIFLSEVIVFLGIAGILFYVDFLGTTIILFSVGVISFVIYILTIGKISFFGKERNIVGGELNKHLLQGMASAKDVKILDREEDLIYQVDKNLSKMTKLNQVIQFIGGLPRFSFEVLIVFIFSTLIFVMIESKRDMVDVIQYLGIFAVASYRIIPGATRILTSFQTIKYMEPSVRLLLNEFNLKNIKKYKKENTINSLQFDNEINLKNLFFSYSQRKDFSLSNISMNIKKGNSIGIIGETGSGKSTLINLIIGLLEPSRGVVEVDKINIHSNLSKWFEKIGYVPQSVYLTDDTIKKNIAFGLRDENINDLSIKQAIEKASLNKFIDTLPNGLDTVVGEKGIRLSGGQQQRIGIARALYRNPEILILDEATSSLDQMTESKIMDSVHTLKGEKTLIIITHRLFTVERCDKIFFIEKGKVTKEGKPKDIL